MQDTYFMESEASTQEPATGPYPEPVESGFPMPVTVLAHLIVFDLVILTIRVASSQMRNLLLPYLVVPCLLF
jgi:hypothetical protein